MVSVIGFPDILRSPFDLDRFKPYRRNMLSQMLMFILVATALSSSLDHLVFTTIALAGAYALSPRAVVGLAGHALTRPIRQVAATFFAAATFMVSQFTRLLVEMLSFVGCLFLSILVSGLVFLLGRKPLGRTDLWKVRERATGVPASMIENPKAMGSGFPDLKALDGRVRIPPMVVSLINAMIVLRFCIAERVDDLVRLDFFFVPSRVQYGLVLWHILRVLRLVEGAAPIASVPMGLGLEFQTVLSPQLSQFYALYERIEQNQLPLKLESLLDPAFLGALICLNGFVHNGHFHLDATSMSWRLTHALVSGIRGNHGISCSGMVIQDRRCIRFAPKEWRKLFSLCAPYLDPDLNYDLYRRKR